MISVTTTEELDSILKNNTYVLMDFYTPWCPPCKLIAPYLEELETQYPLVTFVKIDCSDSEIPTEYQVAAVPTFLLFASGKKVGASYGSDRDSLLALIKEKFSQ